MNFYENFLYYSQRVIYWVILGVGVLGIYGFISSEEQISGGAIGVLLMGTTMVADFLNLPAGWGEKIFTASISLLMFSLSVSLIQLPKIIFKIFGGILILGSVYFFITSFLA